MVLYVKILTPLGEMVLASEEDALCGAWFVGQKYFPDLTGFRPPEGKQSKQSKQSKQKSGPLALAAEELERYFAGELRRFTVPLRPRGTPFQKSVWSCIADIPYGELSSYGALAAKLGTGARAVGSATGRNPISVIVPCHRVVGSGGAITGYAGGLDRKKALLRQERQETLSPNL
jgi:methylated-DNA-[protein]-cysteine S-methyltransferase